MCASIYIGFGNPVAEESKCHICQYLSNIDLNLLVSSLDIALSNSTRWKPKDDDTAIVNTSLMLNGYEQDLYIRQLLDRPLVNSRVSQSEYRPAGDIFQYMPIFRDIPKCLPELKHTLINRYNIRDHVSILLDSQTRYSELLTAANDELQIHLNWLSNNTHILKASTEEQFINVFPEHLQPKARLLSPGDHTKQYVSECSGNNLYYNYTDKWIQLYSNKMYHYLILHPQKNMYLFNTILTASGISSYWAGLTRALQFLSALSDRLASIGIKNNKPSDYGQDITNIGWSYKVSYLGSIDSNRSLVVNIGVSRDNQSHRMIIELFPIKNNRRVDNQDGSTVKYTVGPYYTNPSSPHFSNIWLDPACPSLIINENELISKTLDDVKIIIHTHLNN